MNASAIQIQHTKRSPKQIVRRNIKWQTVQISFAGIICLLILLISSCEDLRYKKPRSIAEAQKRGRYHATFTVQQEPAGMFAVNECWGQLWPATKKGQKTTYVISFTVDSTQSRFSLRNFNDEWSFGLGTNSSGGAQWGPRASDGVFSVHYHCESAVPDVFTVTVMKGVVLQQPKEQIGQLTFRRKK
jgi:hypothetical protein